MCELKEFIVKFEVWVPYQMEMRVRAEDKDDAIQEAYAICNKGESRIQYLVLGSSDYTRTKGMDVEEVAEAQS